MTPQHLQHRQPFHLVDYSPWPLVGAISALMLTVGLASWFHTNSIIGLMLGLTITSFTMLQWWRDVLRESVFSGFHTHSVVLGLRWGMALFIASEVLFFFSFFWAFFHSSLAPTPEVGCIWPPIGVDPVNTFSSPLFNTGLLLASGVTVTWAHHALMENKRSEVSRALAITIMLGAYFTLIQLSEYLESPFTIADSVFGSTFFVPTGFHGLHVLIGSSFLLVCLLRNMFHQYSPEHHFGFEAAVWYWHFVDVVWLFLFVSIYWWGC